MNIELLTIYTLSVDGTTYERFLVDGSPVELVEYSYSSERMGATQLTATVRHRECLDTLWSGREFVCLDEGALIEGGVSAVEKFFLAHTPSSSKSNEDARYVHTLEFRAERDILLSGVYFCDAVNPSAASAGKPASNSYEVKFVGTLDEFVQRFNDVLSYRGLGSRFSVSLESAVQGSTQSLELVFDKVTLADALQRAVETWEVPFYFLGDSAVFGSADSSPLVSVEYGVDNELLSVSMNNRNEKRVTRIAGCGSSDNVPYYYPNPTPKGTLALGGTFASGASISDGVLFSQAVGQGDTLTYEGKDADFGSIALDFNGQTDSETQVPTAAVEDTTVYSGEEYAFGAMVTADLSGGFDRRLRIALSANIGYGEIGPGTEVYYVTGYDSSTTRSVPMTVTKVAAYGWDLHVDRVEVTFGSGSSAKTKQVTDYGTELTPRDILFQDRQYFAPETLSAVVLDFDRILPLFPDDADLSTCIVKVTGHLSSYVDWLTSGSVHRADFTAERVQASSAFDPCGWYNGDEPIGEDLSVIGLSVTGTPSEGDTLTQLVTGYVTPTGRLMPSIYRDTNGAQRAYDADNTPPSAYAQAYVNPDTGQYYVFEHEYDPREPHEHVEEFDVSPSIRNLQDGQGNPLNVLNDVYFDTGYNVRDVLPNGDLRYNHFFVKLKPLGFNLFDCAIEDGDMAVVMSDGPCAGCHFKILVTSDGKNPVQKNANGTLKKDSDGYGVIDPDNIQANQQDTTGNAVWVALGLDDQTFGGGEYGTMPAYDKAANTGVKPAAGDAFVLENILLPQAFFTAAEQELDRQMVRFMWENNAEKFDPSVNFSRIYLAEHPTVRSGLSDHSRLSLTYDGRTFAPLYVSQITLNVKEGEPLPEIQVQTKDVVEPRSAGLDERIAAAAEAAVNVVQNGTGGADLEETDKRYLRKDDEDTAHGKITFEKGLEVGAYQAGLGGIGGTVYTNKAGEAIAEFDFLSVRKKATFTQVEVESMRKISGRVLISLADITVSAVEAVSGGWKCFFKSEAADGSAITSGFVAGDQAICQTFSNSNTHYYWRLVTDVGPDWITLSASDCDTNSDVPEVGDSVIQLGNRTDASRQAAEILSCYGENSPSLVIYAGINSYSLSGKDISGFEYRETSSGSGVWKPYFFNYGPMLLGDRNKTQEYVEFADGVLNVKGRMTVRKSDGTYVAMSTYIDNNDLAYLKAATNNGTTLVDGGLILSNLMALGQTVSDQFQINAGINGIMNAERTRLGGGVAAWFGGIPSDKDDPDTGVSDYAKTVFRFDGSGYLAGGNIHWDENGYGGIPGITWSRPPGSQNDVITIGSNVVLEAGQGADQSVASLVSSVNSLQQILDWFEEVNLGTAASPQWAVRLKKKTVGSSQLDRSFVTYGDQIVISGDPGGGGGGGATTLAGLDDVAISSQTDGQALLWSAAQSKWVNGNIVTDLSNYYTKSQTDNAIATAITALNLGAAATYAVASSVTQNDTTHLVTGAAVYSAINTAISSAIKFQGITTTALTDGSTTNPITIDGQSFTAQRGDEVIYGGKEFLWTGSKWQQLGDEESWALKTITISAGTGLTGGGNLEANRTISLSQDSIDKLALAATAYQKPSGGIPKTDLASAVQTSLGKADTALQSHQPIYTLTLNVGSNQVGTYTPNSAAATLTITAQQVYDVIGASKYHKYGGDNSLNTFKIGGATFTWHPAVGNTPGYLSLDSAFQTSGDQIVVSGTPGGGGGGGAEWLYELSDVYGTTAVLRANGTEKQVGDVLQYYDSTKGWVAVPSTSIGITTDATQSVHGLMSAADKTKLDYVGFGTAGSDYVPVYLGGSTPTNVLTAHQSLAGYLPLAGGTMTGTLYARDILPSANYSYNLGSASYGWKQATIREIDARHLDASLEYTGDRALYIGWGAGGAITDSTHFYYSYQSGNDIARTEYAQINASGLYALTRFGVNGQNTNYTFYVNGNAYVSSHINFGGYITSDYGCIHFGNTSNPGYSLSSNEIVNYTGLLHLNCNGTADGGSGASGQVVISKMGTNGAILDINNIPSGTRIFYFPNATGTLALTSDLSSYLPLSAGSGKPLTSDLYLGGNNLQSVHAINFTGTSTSFSESENQIVNYGGHLWANVRNSIFTIAQMGTNAAELNISALTTTRSFAFPNTSGTIALTSDISSALTSYLPLSAGSGKALTGDLYLGDHSIYDVSSMYAGTYHSSVATGTAPLYVESTTVVSNLNADLLDGLHGSQYVPRKADRFYPFVDHSNMASYYKVTLPYSGTTSTGWWMITMDLRLGGSYGNGANGVIHLQYYFYGGNGAYSAYNVCALASTAKIGAPEIYIKYDIANPAVFYVYVGNVYNSFAVENVTVSDSAANLDMRDTTVEVASGIPANCTSSVPITTLSANGTTLTCTSNFVSYGAITVGSTTLNTSYPLYVAGTIASSGDQVITSDVTKKTNFKDINLSVEQIANAPAVTFDWKAGGHSFGSIAQYWKPLLGEMVLGEEGNYTLAYAQGAFVNAIINARAIVALQDHETEQDKEIRELKAALGKANGRIADLEKEVEQLRMN